MPRSRSRFVRFVRNLGPGLLAGVSDDDPSGIGTYVQAGARFGYAMLWTMPLLLFFMIPVQELSGRLGRATGHGIAGNIRHRYPAWLSWTTLPLIAANNLITLSADLAAMGAAVQLLGGGHIIVGVVLSAAVSVALLAALRYRLYVDVLKWLTLTLLCYIAVAWTTNIQWREAMMATFVPRLSMSRDYLVLLVAVIGTTISPYMFFWQAEEEAEDIDGNRRAMPAKDSRSAHRHMARIRTDTVTGMVISNAVGFFIILAAGATLFAHGQHDVQTAAEAARSLEPLAGVAANWLFAAGILGSGLLALPVLAGSAAYAAGEALHWPVGLDRPVHRAHAFYTVLFLAVAIGVLANLFQINPIQALVIAGVINGLVAVPILVLLILLTRDEEIMGRFTAGRLLQAGSWATAALMTASNLAMLAMLI